MMKNYPRVMTGSDNSDNIFLHGTYLYSYVKFARAEL